MTPSFARIGAKRSVRARAQEASSRLQRGFCSVCLTHQMDLVTQMYGVVLSLREPPASSVDHITAVLNLISYGYQLYRGFKES
ncbi:hypothetical protein [Streptomyces similanensis]|uniref:Uncharacterized protein n=1 Tax=Streptomyces similanensis TaxID=1274988 RepID=A0ABP9K3G8_9ACTN|nr:hypothetical protein HUT11_21795 [Streptomyces seoulensis]